MHEFLKDFTIRMKKVGAFGVLFKNSMSKTTWKIYGFESFSDQTNLIFATLLFIMESSLKEEPCTMDEIANFIDQLNMQTFKRPLSYEQSRELAVFIVNVVLCHDGRPMTFESYEFNEQTTQTLSISFIANKVVYVDEVRRTSYYLTDEGYALLLSTLEVESHLELTIQEMIFKLHLEKAAYDKAVDDVKEIFYRLRRQVQKIEQSMHRIRQNALLYTVEDYGQLTTENLEMIGETKLRFENHREQVSVRVQEFEEKNIMIQKLEGEDLANLKHLQTIESYLSHAIDEYQRILNAHFDLSALYEKELQGYTQMSLIKRFDFRTEVYERVLSDVSIISHSDELLRPLFSRELDKTYNLNQSLALQRPVSKREVEAEFFTTEEETDIINTRLQLQKAKLKQYQQCLITLLKYVVANSSLTLQQLREEVLKQDEQLLLIPTIDIFKEVMLELLQAKSIDIQQLQVERSERVSEESYEFVLSSCLLDALEANPSYAHVRKLDVHRLKTHEVVSFSHLIDAAGEAKKINCSNVLFEVNIQTE